MFKKFLLVFVLVAAVFGLTACDKKTEGVGYGVTHKDYVGVATMTLVNGEVETVTFEEVYLPYSWAKVVVADPENLPADVLKAPTNHGDAYYGKYIVIGDKKFTGTLRDADLVINGVTYGNEKIKWTATGVDDLYVWLRNSEENCKWYAETVTAGNAYVSNEGFTAKSTYETAGNKTTDGKLGFVKSTTGYWPQTETVKLGWKGNMEEIVKAIKGTKMGVTADKLVKATEGTKTWSIDGVTTGATLSDFKDYYEVAQRAYNNAK